MPSARKRRKRKIQVGRLALVAGAAALVIGLTGIAGHTAVSHFTKKTEPVLMTTDGEIIERVDLDNLRNHVGDVLSMKNLIHLKEDINTYIYNNQLDDLKQEILTYFQENQVDQTKISWAVQDLTTDAYIESDNAAQNFVAASTYKLPLVMLWYERVANGTASMDQTFTFTKNMLEEEDDENPDQPIVKKYKIGDQIPLQNLLTAAALYSDNVAGHILYENLGGFSAYRTEALKYSEASQTKEFTSGKNVLNADYMMDVIYQLYHTQGTYDELKWWLYNAGRDMFLNKNSFHGYVQKVGNLNEHRNVAAYAPTEFPFSICIYSEIDKDKGEQIIADLGDICWNYFQEKYNSGFYDSYDQSMVYELASFPAQPVSVFQSIPDLVGGTAYDEGSMHAEEAQAKAEAEAKAAQAKAEEEAKAAQEAAEQAAAQQAQEQAAQEAAAQNDTPEDESQDDSNPA